MNNTHKLLRLAAENPDLPIVPMVYYDDVVGEGCGYWLCEFGDCYVGEYALYNDRYYEDRDELKDDYYCSNVEDFEAFTNDDDLEKALDADTDHMWTKAIIVYINA